MPPRPKLGPRAAPHHRPAMGPLSPPPPLEPRRALSSRGDIPPAPRRFSHPNSPVLLVQDQYPCGPLRQRQCHLFQVPAVDPPADGLPASTRETAAIPAAQRLMLAPPIRRPSHALTSQYICHHNVIRLTARCFVENIALCSDRHRGCLRLLFDERRCSCHQTQTSPDGVHNQHGL